MISEERVWLFVTGCICLTDEEMQTMSVEQRANIRRRLLVWDELNAGRE